MKNKVLDYLSVLHEHISNELSNLDENLTEFDDGIARNKDAGIEVSVECIDNIIAGLNTLRDEISSLSYNKFCEKHNLNENV